MVETVQYQTYYVFLMTVNVTIIALVAMLGACLCCKRKDSKSDLLGVEGMVKLKNPDEVVIVTTVGNSESQADLNLSTVSNADSEKRASTAAHRSLPDIPVADANGDNGSELYETVADKQLLDAQANEHKSPSPSLKKHTSISQHSSISQADDVSSPYSRVKNSPHNYAKVRTTEHPYAQLNAPSTSAAAAGNNAGTNSSHVSLNIEAISRGSHHSDSSQNVNNSPPQAEIPAASAIAGMISASQDLPYMTPPIANQHFSGDSQDSSKGYTSISVREPLANILAQQPAKPLHRNTVISHEISDSHYATVSDDSDETYAAIDDPGRIMNVAADIYTSGSETYAQIQPMQSNSIVVSVEINNSGTSNVLPNNNLVGNVSKTSQPPVQLIANTAPQHTLIQSRPTSDHATPIPPPVDTLRAQMHSRQASSSSNNSSSVGNLSSPKPEKRQANSPLPPTPKSNASQHLQANSNSNLTSGRNSVISVIECGGNLDTSDSNAVIINSSIGSNSPPQKKNIKLSPSKDIEGMYAKVMKKNKFSRNSPSSQNNSPIMARKYNENAFTFGVSPLDPATIDITEGHKINISVCETLSNEMGKNRTRSNSFSAKDHGYETIPADAKRNLVGVENRKSDCYANILQKERQQAGAQSAKTKDVYNNGKPPIDAGIPHTNYNSEKHYETIPGAVSSNISDPGYETVNKHNDLRDIDKEQKSSDYDPNYEILKCPKHEETRYNSAGLSDDGYAKVVEKKRINVDEDIADGYSKVKGEECEECTVPGYSTIGETKTEIAADANHNYASISEAKGTNNETNDSESDHYAKIGEANVSITLNLSLNLTSSSVITNENIEVLAPPPPELPITSPSSVNSSSILNNSSATSLSGVTTSTSTMSSRQTPSSSSQYESFTGSDTDPNYESVRYLNTRDENPYEKLHPDYSDTQLNSPLTPEERPAASSVLINTSSNVLKIIAADSNDDVKVVHDYFQV